MKTTPQQQAEALEIDRIHNLIVEEPKKYANRLPEAIFRDYFLPAFAGKVPLVKHYEEWISIAGAPTAEVAIVDEGGVNVIFNVPPIMNTDHIQRTRPEGAMPFAAIVSMAEAFRTKSGAQSDQVMTAQGMDRVKAAHDKKYDYSPLEKRWLEIFQRYGIVPVDPKQTSASATSAAAEAPSTAIDDDDFIEQ